LLALADVTSREFNIMKVLIVILFVLTSSSPILAQTKESNFKNYLRNAISTCEKNIYDFELDKVSSVSKFLTLDYKNGYAHVEAPTSDTCGCSCSSTAVVFFDEKHNPTFLENHSESCNWHEEIKSSRPFSEILPINFTQEFGLANIPDDKMEYFYFQVSLPRKGVETIFSIHLMPIGTKKKCDNGICFGLVNIDKTDVVDKNLNYIDFVLEKNEREKLFNLVESGKPLPSHKLLISKLKLHQKNLQDLQNDLKYLFELYKLRESIKHDSVVMKWDRKKAKFVIVKKISHKTNSFLEFMNSKTIYSPLC
ncbi:MAG: hypothetical protein ACXVCP_20190, partial [Bdellovibrio sp.]